MEGQQCHVALTDARRPFWDRFLEALFPEFCVLCRNEGRVFCHVCRSGWVASPFIDVCPTCTRPVCLGDVCHACAPESVIDGLFAVGSYKDPVMKGLLRPWKYAGARSASEEVQRIVSGVAHEYRHLLSGYETVSWVPLHQRRKNERGFDQAQILARTVATSLGVPVLSLLRRKRYTTPQAKTVRTERDASEFEGVFQAVSLRVPESVLLVDDVWTTGTTLLSAAKTLKRAGVRRLRAFTLARG